jgi:hypothetical protein
MATTNTATKERRKLRFHLQVPTNCGLGYRGHTGRWPMKKDVDTATHPAQWPFSGYPRAESGELGREPLLQEHWSFNHLLKSHIERPSHLTREYANTCVDRNHRNYANCAEIGAFARARADGLELRGSHVAVYATQGNIEGWAPPCRMLGGRWGCAEFCEAEDVRSVTKRSKVERQTEPFKLENALVIRDPKPRSSKSSADKAMPKTSTALPGTLTLVQEATTLTSQLPTFTANPGPVANHKFVVTLNWTRSYR